MKLVHGSVVDTAVAFIKQNFKVKMDTEAVAQQMKTMSFKQQMDLVDAMKEDNPDEFQALINIEQSKDVEEAAGQSVGVISNKPNNDYSSMIKQQNRNAVTGRGQPDQVVRGDSGNVAGGNKSSTGGPQGHSPANKNMNAQDMQRQQNSQQAAQNAQQTQINAQEIERLKQLAMGRR